jgi:general secretion pathway protein G
MKIFQQNIQIKKEKGFALRPIKQSRTERGFTLVELMVVVAIIAILVTLVIIAINPVKLIRESQDARRRSDLQAIRTSMQLYYNDFKVFPAALSDLEPTYIRKLPTDPSSGGNYIYQTYNAAADYVAAGTLAETPTADDNATVSKCGTIGNPGGNYQVCND